jgi:hypothetical protein
VQASGIEGYLNGVAEAPANHSRRSFPQPTSDCRKQRSFRFGLLFRRMIPSRQLASYYHPVLITTLHHACLSDTLPSMTMRGALIKPSTGTVCQSDTYTRVGTSRSLYVILLPNGGRQGLFSDRRSVSEVVCTATGICQSWHSIWHKTSICDSIILHDVLPRSWQHPSLTVVNTSLISLSRIIRSCL